MERQREGEEIMVKSPENIERIKRGDTVRIILLTNRRGRPTLLSKEAFVVEEITDNHGYHGVVLWQTYKLRGAPLKGYILGQIVNSDYQPPEGKHVSYKKILSETVQRGDE